MAQRRPQTAYTQDDLLRKIPGWKPPTTAAPADGEPAELPQPGTSAREPILPEFKVSGNFDFISKNGTDNARQQQLEEIN